MMGGALGGLESMVFPHQGIGFWALVSMGAILGGTMRSPLTGIIFSIELTRDLNMLLPLVVAVTVAHAFTVLVLRRSILTEKVARRGFHVSREYAIDELEILFVRDVMKSEVELLAADMTPTAALATLSPQAHDHRQFLYPLLDAEGILVGSATFSDLQNWAADPATANRPLAELASTDLPTVYSNETLRAAVEQMAEDGVTRLLVVNPADARRLVGVMALHDLLKARAKHLEDETRRERILPWEYILPRWLRPAAQPEPAEKEPKKRASAGG
jgi:CBS domain-containing protein